VTQAVREEVEYHLLHGIPKEELEEVMKRVFEAADENGNGELSMDEFRQCLKSAELGLTRKEINLLLSECDTNQVTLVPPPPPRQEDKKHPRTILDVVVLLRAIANAHWFHVRRVCVGV